jgi:CheY-like chemotaxis protein
MKLNPGSRRGNDHELRDYVRRSVHTYFHYAGTCRMGTDEHAVVDAELRVQGVEGAARDRCLGDAVTGQRQHQRHRVRNRRTRRPPSACPTDSLTPPQTHRTAMAGLRVAVTARPHLVLLDLELPDQLAIDQLPTLRAAARAPVIAITSRADERHIVSAMNAGANSCPSTSAW